MINSNNAIYTGFQFEADGYPALAVINSSLKTIDKQQYPYAVFIQLIPDSYNENGHPEGEEYDYLNDVEKKIIDYLESQTQTVHVGHVTAFRLREIILYTNEAQKATGFLDYFLTTIERENSFDIEPDDTWENVSAFYENI